MLKCRLYVALTFIPFFYRKRTRTLTTHFSTWPTSGTRCIQTGSIRRSTPPELPYAEGEGLWYRYSDMSASPPGVLGRERTVWLYTSVTFKYTYKHLRESEVKLLSQILSQVPICMRQVEFIICSSCGIMWSCHFVFLLDNSGGLAMVVTFVNFNAGNYS